MKTRAIILALAVAACLHPLCVAAAGESLTPDELKNFIFEQKRGAAVPTHLEYRDETGAPVRLQTFFHGLPVVLVLADYECPHLCNVVLSGLLDGVRQLKMTAGSDFEIVVVSIRPEEKPATAAARQYVYASRYGRADKNGAHGWHFLTEGRDSARSLADAIGYHYSFDAASNQFAHPSGIVVLTPTGKVSSYLLGIEFPGTKLQPALEEASREKMGPLAEKLLLLCFHYDPITGRYGLVISRVLKIAGIATTLALLGLIVHFRRRERQAATVP
jgi:protein SCO1/2